MYQVRTDMRARILAALELRIPLHEATLARLGATESLDAWSAFHLGLQHVYRFNRADTAVAQALFEQAVARDPPLCAGALRPVVRALPGRVPAPDRRRPRCRRPGASACAERGLELDPLDPFVNFTMGRTFWLTGDLETAHTWLERATTFSPNYAQGVYACAWTETLAGHHASAASTSTSRCG